MPHFKKIVLASALSIAVFAPASNAALVTEIIGLDIGGTLYDVTFNSGASDSFNALWDSNGDETFGNDASAFNAAPTFWDDSAGAEAAANAIAAALSTHGTTSANSDRFLVPYGFNTILTGNVNSWYESVIASYSDSVVMANIGSSVKPALAEYASFTPTVVPVPAAVWLFGSGLIGLIGLARRKVRV